MSKILKPGQKGTIIIDDVDFERIITRDLSDHDRTNTAIEDYADAYESDVSMPPISVFLIDGGMVCVDGYHRCQAALAAGKMSIVAECVGEGDERAGFVWAVHNANQGVGLRLSEGDCKKRVYDAFDKGIYDCTPATVMAKELGMNRRTVTKYMRQWEEEQTAKGKTSLPETVKYADGREVPRKKPKVSNSKATVHSAQYLDQKVGRARDQDPEDNASGEPEPSDAPQTAQPIPTTGRILLEATGRVRAARLELREILAVAVLQPEAAEAEQRLKGLEIYLRGLVPEVCPRCEGKGCEPCQERGWTSQSNVEQWKRSQKILRKASGS